jgi:hypothetical protein
VNSTKVISGPSPRSSIWRAASIQFLVVLGALILASAVRAEGSVEEPNSPTDEDKALVEKFDKALPQILKTAGREPANFVANPTSWLHNAYLVMKGEKRGKLSSARSSAGARMREALMGLEWPVPKDVEVPQARGKVVIDGNLDEVEWSGAVELTGMFPLNEKESSELKNKWRLMWDHERLYIAMEARNSDVIATKEPRDAPIYKNDCAEIFILPSMEKGTFWELLLNPAGSVFDALHQKYVDKWGEEPGGKDKTMADLQFETRVVKDGDKSTGYIIEASIPLAQLPHFDPAKDRSLYLMLVRAEKNKHDDVSYYSYTPLLAWSHNIWNFGKFTLK